jgi:hypothetical protein
MAVKVLHEAQAIGLSQRESEEDEMGLRGLQEQQGRRSVARLAAELEIQFEPQEIRNRPPHSRMGIDQCDPELGR